MSSTSIGTIINTIFWILIALALITPLLRQRALENARIAIIRVMETKRKSRVIVIIHRQETMSFLGIPIARYISIEDSEAVLRVIRLTPDDMPKEIYQLMYLYPQNPSMRPSVQYIPLLYKNSNVAPQTPSKK
jgi:hypothetical protein